MMPPCRCDGVRFDKCDCGVLQSNRSSFFRHELTGVALGAPRFRPTTEQRYANHRYAEKSSLLTRLVERLYEKCAGYNLRHCPFRGFANNENYLSNALRDLLLLACFLLANFVVFTTILTRMSIQLVFLVFESAKWIRRVVSTTPSNVHIGYSQVPVLKFEEDYRRLPVIKEF